MFVDASALTAILTGESDERELLRRLQGGAGRQTSPMAIWETVVAVARRRRMEIDDAENVVESFLGLADIRVAAVPAEARHIAVAAFARFGKGRHPAALNFGDCFAYACARQAGMPLLFKGDDFPQTDIEPA